MSTTEYEVLFHDRHDDLDALVTNALALGARGYQHAQPVDRGDDNRWWILTKEPVSPESAQAWFETWQLEPDIEAAPTDQDALIAQAIADQEDLSLPTLPFEPRPSHEASGWPVWP